MSMQCSDIAHIFRRIVSRYFQTDVSTLLQLGPLALFNTFSIVLIGCKTCLRGRMLRLPSVVIFLFGLAAGVTGLYEASGPVSLLTQRSFSKVLDSPLPVVVEFFAPW